MQTLSSIQTAYFKYETQEAPVLIMCSDMQDYVCKYARVGDTMKLFCEYLAASFLKIWKLSVPDFAFVAINYDHVKHLGIPKPYIEKTCFGSKHSRHYEELHHFTGNPDVSKQKGYIHNRENFLKIALFDIWLANEDRNFNNMNLLIDVDDYNFIPIDHSFIFNTRVLNYPLTLLSEYESLTNTDLMKLLYPKFLFSKENIQNLKESFYLCTSECKENLDEILNSVPPDWDLDLTVLTQKINELFSTKWEDDVIKTFLEYIRSPY